MLRKMNGLARAAVLTVVLGVSLVGAAMAWVAYPRFVAVFVVTLFAIGALSTAFDAVRRVVPTPIRLRQLRGLR
jgi:hypothetical protein